MVYSMSDKPIAIIGLAGLFPQAKTLEEYWQHILDGKDCIEIVPESRWKISESYHPDPSIPGKTYSRLGGFIPDIIFDPVEYGIQPHQLEQIDCAQLLSLTVAKAALMDAGYGPNSTYDHQRTGIILGAAGTTMQLMENLLEHSQLSFISRILQDCQLPDDAIKRINSRYKDYLTDWKEAAFPGVLANVIAGRISNRFNLGGINCTVDAACASSLAAVNLSLHELINHQCDLMITGGVDANNKLLAYISFSKTPVLTHGEQVRSFDAEADGTLISEGIGMLVLKRLSDAERDQDRIYAIIRGIGVSSDGRNKSIFAPSKQGQLNALKKAYDNAKLSPQKIGLIEAHSPGTRAGDDVELSALSDLFLSAGVGYQRASIGSVKSQIGHAKAAAGAASLIKTTLALSQKVLPPTLHVTTPNPILLEENSPFYLTSTATPWFEKKENKRYAGISSFGFGGSNYHLVLEEYSKQFPKNENRFHKKKWSIILSAENKNQLQIKCQNLYEKLHTSESEHIWEKLLNDSKQCVIENRDVRLGFLTNSISDTQTKLQESIHYLENHSKDKSRWHHPHQIWFYEHSIEGDVIALFSGQGSQYMYMGREFALYHPELLEYSEMMDELFYEDHLTPLTEVLFPKNEFNELQIKQMQQLLNMTHYTQAAVGVLSIAQFCYLRHMGLIIDQSVGHSLGELTALWAAESLSDKEYLSLIYQRGKLFGSLEPTQKTVMLVVYEKIETVRSILTTGLYISNINSPKQVVISGYEDNIVNFIQLCENIKIKTQTIPVSAAFHSPLIKSLESKWHGIVNETYIKSPIFPVYSNNKGDRHGLNTENIKELLKQHPFETVLFQKNIEHSYQSGGRIFIEFGPRHILSKLLQQTLIDKNYISIAINPNTDHNSETQLREALLQLRLIGLDINGFKNDIIPRAIHKSEHQIKLTALNFKSVDYLNRIKQLPEKISLNQNIFNETPRWQSAKNRLIYIHDNFIEYNKALQEKLTVFIQDYKANKELLAKIQILQETQNRVIDTHRDFLSQQKIIENSILNTTTILLNNDSDYTMIDTAKPMSDSISDSGAIIEHKDNSQEKTDDANTLSIKDNVFYIISERTGYPISVLDINMDLESDLGIDSIKRVEIFGFLNINKSTSIHINKNNSHIKTIKHIIDYLSESRTLTNNTSPIKEIQQIKQIHTDKNISTIPVYSMSTKKINYPAPLEYVYPETRSILIMSEINSLSLSLISKLSLYFPTNPIDIVEIPSTYSDQKSIENIIENLFIQFCKKNGTPFSCIYIPIKGSIYSTYIAMSLAKQLKLSIKNELERFSFLVITRIDGQFGFNSSELFDYYSAGLFGLVKTLKLEWPNALCRGIDFHPEIPPDVVSLRITDEIMDSQIDLTEISYLEDSRYTTNLYLIENFYNNDISTLHLKSSDVFLVTGGASGITAECIKELAKKYRCQFIIIGRTEQSKEQEWSKHINTIHELNIACAQYLSLTHKEHTPKIISKIVSNLLKNREINKTLQEIKSNGGNVYYFQSNICIQSDVDHLNKWINNNNLLITGIIHGAGIISDKKIHEKKLDHFIDVIEPKIKGIENIINTINIDNLNYLILFSSTAAAYGNEGQSDYALANEMLNKFSYYYKIKNPACLVMSINWGPWENGMVSSDLKNRFLEKGVKITSIELGKKIFLNTFFNMKNYNQIIVGYSNLKLKYRQFEGVIKKQINISNCHFANQHKINELPILPMAWILLWITDTFKEIFSDFPFFNILNLKLFHGIVLKEHSNQYYLSFNKKEVNENIITLSISIYSHDSFKRTIYHYGGDIELFSYQINPDPYPIIEHFDNTKEYEKYIDLLYSGKFLKYGNYFQGVKKIISLNERQITTEMVLPELNHHSLGNFTGKAINPYAYDIATHSILIWLVHFKNMLCLPSIIGSFQEYRFTPSHKPLFVSLMIKYFNDNESLVIFSITAFDEEGNIYFIADDIQMTVFSVNDAIQRLEEADSLN